MSRSPKVPDLPSTGENPEFEVVVIRGVPHRREKILELEKDIGTVIIDEIMLANLDSIYFTHTRRTGKRPQMIEDEHTHDKFMVVTCSIPNTPLGVLGPQIETNLYFRLKGVISVHGPHKDYL